MYPNLFAELALRGWSDAELAKLASGNFLRVMRGAELTAELIASENVLELRHPRRHLFEATHPSPDLGSGAASN